MTPKIAQANIDAKLAREDLARLTERVRELEADAERYRWLKANHLQTGTDSWIRTGDDLQDAIDAALAKREGG